MIKNLEKQFSKNGYVIFKTKETKKLLELQSKILDLILASNKKAKQNFKKFKNTKDFFINLHRFISLKELNKGRPSGKKHIPWKENQGKSMINSRFQTIEMEWLFNKMPQDQQRNLAAGLLKFAKSMSEWSAAHAKLT